MLRGRIGRILFSFSELPKLHFNRSDLKPAFYWPEGLPTGDFRGHAAGCSSAVFMAYSAGGILPQGTLGAVQVWSACHFGICQRASPSDEKAPC